MIFIRASRPWPASPHLGLGKLVRCLVIERTVRPHRVVIDAPRFNQPLRVGQANKPVFVEALVAKFPVETLDVRVFDRLAGADETERHLRRVRPRLQRATGKLRPVVEDDRLRKADAGGSRPSAT